MCAEVSQYMCSPVKSIYVIQLTEEEKPVIHHYLALCVVCILLHKTIRQLCVGRDLEDIYVPQ